MKNKKLFIFFSLPIILSSCAETLMTGRSSIGYATVQQRSLGDAVDDTTILAEIKSLWCFHERFESMKNPR